jgi:hypothetical protein
MMQMQPLLRFDLPNSSTRATQRPGLEMWPVIEIRPQFQVFVL